MSVVSPVPCSFTHTGTTYDYLPPSLALANATETVNARYHLLNFIDVWTNIAPCDITKTGPLEIFGQRSLLCPANHVLIYQNSPRIGPFCGISWWVPDKRKTAGCPTCRPGQVTKGESVDVASGNKYQREDDYVGAGHHPLTRAAPLQQHPGGELRAGGCRIDVPATALRAWLERRLLSAHRGRHLREPADRLRLSARRSGAYVQLGPMVRHLCTQTRDPTSQTIGLNMALSIFISEKMTGQGFVLLISNHFRKLMRSG